MSKRLAAAMVSGLVLTGCVSLVSGSKHVENKGVSAVEDAKAQGAAPEFSRLRFSDRYFVPDLSPEEEDKPEWWFEEANVRIVESPLRAVMMEFLAPHGVNVRYLDGLDSNFMVSGLVHSGTLGGLVEKLSFATQFSYDAAGPLLSWSRYQTELVQVRADTARPSFRVGDDPGMTGTTGSSRLDSVDTGFSTGAEALTYEFSELDIWTDVESTLAALQSEDGRFVTNRSSSSVMLRDFPSNVRLMTGYLDELNKNLSIALVIDIRVVEFTQTASKRRGLNWSVISEDLSSSGLLSFNSSFRGLMSDSAPPVLSYSHESGKYSGSEVFLDALNANGVSYEVTTQVIHTINNFPKKSVFGGDSGYVAEAGSTATANVGTNVSLRGGVVRTGDEFYVMPNVYGEDVFLTLSSTLSSLNRLRTVESGDTRIELPETSVDQEIGRLRVRDGDTIVLTNSLESSSVNDRSVANVCFFGCESSSNTERRERLILITPRIVRGH